MSRRASGPLAPTWSTALAFRGRSEARILTRRCAAIRRFMGRTKTRLAQWSQLCRLQAAHWWSHHGRERQRWQSKTFVHAPLVRVREVPDQKICSTHEVARRPLGHGVRRPAGPISVTAYRALNNSSNLRAQDQQIGAYSSCYPQPGAPNSTAPNSNEALDSAQETARQRVRPVCILSKMISCQKLTSATMVQWSTPSMSWS